VRPPLRRFAPSDSRRSRFSFTFLPTRSWPSQP
jgi:hypothetical protein